MFSRRPRHARGQSAEWNGAAFVFIKQTLMPHRRTYVWYGQLRASRASSYMSVRPSVSLSDTVLSGMLSAGAAQSLSFEKRMLSVVATITYYFSVSCGSVWFL